MVDENESPDEVFSTVNKVLFFEKYKNNSAGKFVFCPAVKNAAKKCICANTIECSS